MNLFAMQAPWFVAGPLIGFLIVMFLWVTNRPLGMLGGYIEFQEWAAGRRPGPSWRVFLLLGVVLGGFLSALAGGGLHPTAAYGSFDDLLGGAVTRKALVLFGAGMLIGAGGRMARGCTSGHGLCGVSFGSRASLVCTATFMATAIAAAHLLVWSLGGTR